jgi:hypothetical protein
MSINKGANSRDFANTLMKRIEIPLWAFNIYWLGWFLISAVAVAFNLKHLLWPLVIAFIAVETLGIVFTVKDAGTLTDTTAKYVPEDFAFILVGLMLWRLSQWLDDSVRTRPSVMQERK